MYENVLLTEDIRDGSALRGLRSLSEQRHIPMENDIRLTQLLDKLEIIFGWVV